MPTDPNLLLYALIVACEAGFWVVLLAALAVRYLGRNQTLSRVLLLSLPLIDVTLVRLWAGVEPCNCMPAFH